LSVKIEDCSALPIRVSNVLSNLGIVTLASLLMISPESLKRYEKVGRMTLQQIGQFISQELDVEAITHPKMKENARLYCEIYNNRNGD